MRKIMFFSAVLCFISNTAFAAWLGFKEQGETSKAVVMVYKDENMASNSTSGADLLRMAQYGDAVIVDYGTQCYVLEKKFSRAKVRVTSGEHDGYVGWIYIESLRD